MSLNKPASDARTYTNAKLGPSWNCVFISVQFPLSLFFLHWIKYRSVFAVLWERIPSCQLRDFPVIEMKTAGASITTFIQDVMGMRSIRWFHFSRISRKNTICCLRETKFFVATIVLITSFPVYLHFGIDYFINDYLQVTTSDFYIRCVISTILSLRLWRRSCLSCYRRRKWNWLSEFNSWLHFILDLCS